jgi:hypothetical protein
MRINYERLTSRQPNHFRNTYYVSCSQELIGYLLCIQKSLVRTLSPRHWPKVSTPINILA